jgi:hypothetical protein
MIMLSSISSAPLRRLLANAGGMLNRMELVTFKKGESYCRASSGIALALPLSLCLVLDDLSFSDRCFLWLDFTGSDILSRLDYEEDVE